MIKIPKKFLKFASKLPLLRELKALVPQFVLTAQNIYDQWEQDEFGEDFELGAGGICQDIADAIAQVIYENQIPCELEIVDNNGIGAQHVWVIAWNDIECYNIDVDLRYEKGYSYVWTKVPNIIFTPDDIIIEPGEKPSSEF